MMNELTTFVTENEASIRLSFFFGTFLTMAVFELLLPKRKLLVSKVMRWANNISLTVLNTYIIRVLFPTAAVGMAVFAAEQGWGLFNYYDIAFPLAVVLSVILMDMVIYLQHVMVHAVPVLWRLHRVHHADPDFDVTTGARFHPLEIILSMIIKFSIIVVLGAPALAVIIFEILLSSMAMFNHSNVRINTTIDKYLRLLVVTPDMHRVHHSVETDETNSNFGFNLPWWDRLFGTYRAQPRKTHATMDIGIHGFVKSSEVVFLGGLLILPFKGKVTDYSINRRYFDGEK